MKKLSRLGASTFFFSLFVFYSQVFPAQKDISFQQGVRSLGMILYVQKGKRGEGWAGFRPCFGLDGLAIGVVEGMRGYLKGVSTSLTLKE